jgi:endonuclease YncB( thermonuclease family)
MVVALLGLLLSLGCPSHRALEPFVGRVIGVSDGDTLTVLRDGNVQVRIRLAGIDCPEKRQDFGQAAKEHASEMAFGQAVEIRPETVDRYGRTVAVVLCPGGQNLNLSLVRAGLAWHYRAYSDDESLAEAEAEARAAGRGLWSRPDRVPPWEFRRGAGKPREAPAAGDAGMGTGTHWLNTSSGVRHNSGCRHFGKGKSGRSCGPDEGRACGICGG